MESAWEYDASEGLFSGADSVEPSPSVLLYAMLPAMLQRRIPKFKSLRRSPADGSGPGRHSRVSSCSTPVGQLTPPPSYRAAMPSAFDSSDDDDANHFFPPTRSPSREPVDPFCSRPSTSESMTPPLMGEFKSGIQWKYAEAGYSMLSLSSHEASATQPGANLVRQQYISGVSCILRGLPVDLTAEERLSLREALPSTLHPSISSERAMVDSTGPGFAKPGRRASSGITGQTALQCAVAAATCYIFLAITFILPYLQLLLRQVYQFDRKHKITDRMFAQGVAAADSVGRQAIALAGNVCAMHDGKVGEVMKEAGIYVVQSFSGGVYDGLGDGMQALGLRNDSSVRSAGVRSAQLR